MKESSTMRQAVLGTRDTTVTKIALMSEIKV